MPARTRTVCRLVAALCGVFLFPLAALAQSDVQPPQLVDFQISPAVADATAGDATVTLTLEITDDITGLDQLEVRFISPSGSQFRGAAGPGFDFLLQSGDVNNGIWQGSFEIPEFSEAGTWTVQFLHLADGVGNTQFLDAADLAALGLPNSIDVLSVQDAQGPQLADLTITPSIDVSAGPANVMLVARLTDDLTGLVENISQFEVRFRSASGQQFRGASGLGFDFTRIAGDALDGTWQGSFEVPQFSEAGTWTIEFVFMTDAVGNQVSLDAADVQALGLPVSFNVVSVPDDTGLPQVVDLSLTPILIDTTTGDQNVTVTVRLTDDLTGMVENVSQFEIRYRSPSGQQFRGASGLGFDFQLLSGDALDGIWEGTFTVPEFSEAGTWVIQFIFMADAIGNQVSLEAADVEALGLPTTLIVVEPSLIVDGNVDPVAGGTVVDSTFNTAQVVVPPGVLADATDIAIDVFESPLDVPTPTGYTAPGTNFVNISLTPTPAFPLPAPGLTVTLPLSEFLAPGSSLDLFRIDPGTGELVAALDTGGAPISGTVDPAGLSATFAGIAQLSTVVGLVPDKITVAIDIWPFLRRNPVSTRGRNWIPVAILSTPEFDAVNDIMRPLLTFGRTGDEMSLARCGRRPRDINRDGLDDLVCYFWNHIAGFERGDVEGILKGETVTGTPIEGRDAVLVLGRR